MVSSVKAVLFDLVGTLIYVKDSVGTIYANSAMQYGIVSDPNALNNCFYKILERKPKSSGGNVEEKRWWREVVQETFEKSGINIGENFQALFEDIFREFATKSSWGVYLDVIPTLRNLASKKIKSALISNFDNRLPKLLKDLKLSKYFDSLAYSGKVGVSKPDAKIFRFALNELNILPEEAICVGDSLEMDYNPSQALNINALIINRDKHNLKDIKTISNLTQIIEFIDKQIV